MVSTQTTDKCICNRSPLTEEEIKACEQQAMVNGALPHEQRALFARAIERAHGIK